MPWSCWIKPFVPNLIILRRCRSRHTDGTYICKTFSVSIEWVLRSEICWVKETLRAVLFKIAKLLFHKCHSAWLSHQKRKKCFYKNGSNVSFPLKTLWFLYPKITFLFFFMYLLSVWFEGGKLFSETDSVPIFYLTQVYCGTYNNFTS